MERRFLALLVLISCARVILAQGGDAPVPPVRVVLAMHHVFGDRELRLEDVSCRTDAGNTLSITRLAYLVSGVELIRADGSRVALEGAGFFSAGAGRTSMPISNVPTGSYTGLALDVGLPPRLNHADPAQYAPDDPLSPVLNTLHWGWQGGYIFLAIEGRWVMPDDALGGYSYHLATDERRTRVTLPLALDLRRDTTITIRFDAARLFGGPEPLAITPDPATHSTHSSPRDTLAPRLGANISGAMGVESITPGLGAPALPAVPRAEPLAGTTPYPLRLPEHFPRPELPADNPLTLEGVRLGKRLFHERRLSLDDSVSCASCHQPSAAYSDAGKAFSAGVDGRTGSRNAMPLFNLAWSSSSGYTWDGRRAKIRDQVLAPIQDQREMRLPLDRAIEKLGADAEYPAQFHAAFGSDAITPERLGLAVEQYLLTLISADSRFDRALDQKAQLTPIEKQGLMLFVTEHDPARGQFGADCFHCHGGNLFSDYQFRTNGLDRDSADPGRAGVSGRDADRGRFKTPSLRNVEVTAPYMHDGRFASIAQVLEHYSEHLQGADNLDPNLAKHILTLPDGSRRAGVRLSPQDREALEAFLKTLTDEHFLHDADR